MRIVEIREVKTHAREIRLVRKCVTCEKRRLTTRITVTDGTKIYDIRQCNDCLCASPNWGT